MNTIANDKWRLDGKKALVTGATKGIGAATAEALLHRSRSNNCSSNSKRSRQLFNQVASARLSKQWNMCRFIR